jgi:DNA-binding MarR family transcriptional regulator
VTFSQFVILDAVGKTGTLRLSDLHGILGVEKSTTTRLVDPLVMRGLIFREKSQRDSRAVTLRLSGEGKTVLRKVWDCLSTALNTIEFALPEDHRTEIYKAVRTFSKAVQRACAAGACDKWSKKGSV